MQVRSNIQRSSIYKYLCRLLVFFYLAIWIWFLLYGRFFHWFYSCYLFKRFPVIKSYPNNIKRSINITIPTAGKVICKRLSEYFLRRDIKPCTYFQGVIIISCALLCGIAYFVLHALISIPSGSVTFRHFITQFLVFLCIIFIHFAPLIYCTMLRHHVNGLLLFK